MRDIASPSGTFSPEFARARTRAMAIVAGLLAVPLVALAIEVGWRYERWHAELQSVRFADHSEKVSAGASAVAITGYLAVTVRSDVDFFALARTESTYPQAEAELCDSSLPLKAWLHPMPREVAPGDTGFAYAVLVPIRGKEFDLSKPAGDVCVRFRAVTMNPLSWVRSRAVVVPLPDELREQMAAYVRRGGVSELTLDPACAPQLCEPDFSASSELRPESRP